MTYFSKSVTNFFEKKWGKKPQIGFVVWVFTCITDIYNNKHQTQFSWMGRDDIP